MSRWNGVEMRAVTVLLSLMLVSASPAKEPIEIPSGLGEEALVIPATSPVHFERYGKDYEARFSGRFVVTGTFFYGCEMECDPPLQRDQVFAAIVPDPAVAATLPHWKIRNNDIRIFFINDEQLVNQIVTRPERAALLAGRIPDVRRHVAIIVDDFRAAIDCDSAYYSAHFVAMAKPVEETRAKLNGDYGCG